MYLYERRDYFLSLLPSFCFSSQKMNDHCFSKTGDSWSDTVPKTMTLVLIFSGSLNSETKNDNWAQRGWNHSHHYIRTKTLETEPETPRSSVESRTLCHKASWSEGWSQQYHARELSWKHSSENRVLDFGNRLKHILMVRKRLNKKKRWSQALKMEWSYVATVATREHIIVTRRDMTGLRGQSAQPGCPWVNVLEFAFCGIIALMTQPAEQCDRWVDSL